MQNILGHFLQIDNRIVPHITQSDMISMGRQTQVQESNTMIHTQEGVSQGAVTKIFHQGNQESGPLANCHAGIKLNNEAVVLLISAIDNEKAMQIFKLGLNHVRSSLSSSRPSGGPDQHEESHPESCIAKTNRRPSFCTPDDHSHTVHVVPVSLTSTPTIDDSFYLYANAFTFQYSHLKGKSHPSSQIDAEMLSATIIYNIALVLNIKALQTNCSVLQRRSLKLYEMSMGLINNMMMQESKEKMDPVLSTSRKNNATRLAIACSNNMAQLAFLQGNYERSRTMLNTLEYLLSPRSASSNGQDVSLLFHDADILGFKLNIIFMYPPTTAPAA